MMLNVFRDVRISVRMTDQIRPINFLCCFSYFWCSAVTSLAFSSNLSNFEKIFKIQKEKNPKKIPKNLLKNPEKTQTNGKCQKIFKKIQKSSKKNNLNFYFFALKKWLSSQFYYLRRLVFDRSFPVHPVSESRGGSPEHQGDSYSNKILIQPLKCAVPPGFLICQ